MENTIKEIIEYIVHNYETLPKSNIDGKELVIFATGSFSGEYGYGSSDLQSWGVDKDGKLFWAYASGCSCYCNAGVNEMTMKVFETKPPKDNEDTNLLKMIGLFVTNKDEFRKEIGSYHYTFY